MKQSIIFLVTFLFAIGTCFAASSQVAYHTSDPQLDATLLTQNPEPARSGDTVNLNIKIENIGGKDAENVKVELLPEFPFSFTSDESVSNVIGKLPNYPTDANFKIIKYKLLISKEAIDKTYEVKFRYTQDNGKDWTVARFPVKITSTEFAQIIQVDKTKINPGEETPLLFTIHNIGKAPLTNLIFTWNEKDKVILPVGTDNTRYIPYLGIGESAKLEYTVVANPSAERGLYNLNLELDFDGTNTTGSAQSSKIITNAGILIGGSTDFDVALADSSGGKTSFSIANTGKNDAASVSMKIPEQKGFSSRGGSAVIIGNLNKGDFTIVSFQISPTMPIQKDETRSLLMNVSFTDSFGERHTLEKSIDMKVSQVFLQNATASSFSGNRVQNSSNTTWIILIALIIAIVSFYIIVKNKKMKRS